MGNIDKQRIVNPAMPPLPFIPPCQPSTRVSVPSGSRWLHEVKFDGYRVQLHRSDDSSCIYSKTGAAFDGRFPTIAYVLRSLPARSTIIDAEIVACSQAGCRSSMPCICGGPTLPRCACGRSTCCT
jgi:bifunctional non-homologous end joining protein LigD